MADQLVGYYKPRDLFAFWRWAEPVREIAAYLVAEEFGWSDLMATTVEWRGPKGRGSVQLWHPDAEPGWRDVRRYNLRDRQRAALIDYAIANLDRGGPRGHPNHLRHGTVPLLIDNGEAFPMHAVDPRRLGKRLRKAGLPGCATRLTLARIRAAQRRETVTVEMFRAVRNRSNRKTAASLKRVLVLYTLCAWWPLNKAVRRASESIAVHS